MCHLLHCRTNHVEGDIMTNGSIRNLRKFRKMSCYIMQDDQLLPHLAVEEALLCSASLKLAESMIDEEKNSLVNIYSTSISLVRWIKGRLTMD